MVQRPDRKDLLAYLRGETNTSQSIDKNLTLELPKNYHQLMKELYPNGIPSANSAATGDTAGDDAGPSASKIRRMDDVEKIRQQFSARLDAPKMKLNRSEMDLGNPESLLDAMSLEKISALKTKRLAKKRSMIVDADVDLENGQSFAINPNTSVLLDLDSDFTKNIQNVEVIMRDRKSVLQSQTKNFAKSVFPIIAQIKFREEGANKEQKSRNAPQMAPPQMNNTSSGTQQYNRYDQERFTKDTQVGFRIDTTSSYHGFALKNFTDVSANQKLSSNNGNASLNNNTNNPAPKPQKRVSRTPIIVIPATNTSLITISNAQTILQDFKFIDTKECPHKSDNEVLIQRKKSDNTTVPYRIVCNISKLTPDDW